MTNDPSFLSWLQSDEFKKQVDDAINKAFEGVEKHFDSLSTLDLLSLRPPVSPLVDPEPPDVGVASLVPHPCVVLILGHRGRGKTALACRLQELKKDVAAPYGVGLPSKASRLLPDWYGISDDFTDIPSNAVIYVPESYRLFHARASQTAQGRAIGDLVNLSRHRRHTLIFDVQNPAHLDRNIISEADVVMIAESQCFGRPESLRQSSRTPSLDERTLIEQYPKLYHMAEAGSWPLILNHGLLSTSALLDLLECPPDQQELIELRHRPEKVHLHNPDIGSVVIRDQKPMSDSALRKVLTSGTPEDWYRLLNPNPPKEGVGSVS